MALKFPYVKYAQQNAYSWVEGTDYLSLSCRVRIDELESPAIDQYVVSITGSTGYIGLKRDKTSGKFKVVCNQGGVYVTKEATGTVTLGTWYHVAWTWRKNYATGLRLWIDGSEQGSGTSTTTQTGTFSAGSPSLWLGCYKSANNYGRCSLERLLVVRDIEIASTEIAALRLGVWPADMVLAKNDHAHYDLDQAHTTTILDTGPSRRHFTTIVGAEATGYAGLIEAPRGLEGISRYRGVTGGSGPPAPSEWVEWPTGIDHPGQEVEITGLTDGTTYEIKVVARDAAGNQSADSAIAEATPQAWTRHVSRRVLIGRK